MPGADIVQGAVVNGVGHVTDRYATEYAIPDVDCTQVSLLLNVFIRTE
jgi:hypothetical protein